jgi:hypothetical protein
LLLWNPHNMLLYPDTVEYNPDLFLIESNEASADISTAAPSRPAVGSAARPWATWSRGSIPGRSPYRMIPRTGL